jgi:hypothetical protein
VERMGCTPVRSTVVNETSRSNRHEEAMEEHMNKRLTRREMLRLSGTVAAGSLLATLVPAAEAQVIKGTALAPEPAQAAEAGVYEVLPPYGKATIEVWEPPETTIVFTGTLEAVLKRYREKMWTDGLPIVPPTVEKVVEFLKYTDHAADAELTRPLPPSYRIATPWSVAVNGVMAGCRPEYMPVLIAMTKAWGEVDFAAQDISSTTGCTPIAFINGRIKRQLGINFRQSYGLPAYQSNTSMGRFWSMFKRNLMEMRIEPPTEMAAHGMNCLNLCCEDDETVHELGWKTLAEERGFQTGDNVVTAMSVLCQSEAPAIVGSSGEELLDGICGQICEGACCQWRLFSGQFVFVIPALIAQVLAKDGWNKNKMRDYLYKNARQTARFLETRLRRNQSGYYCAQVKAGNLPRMFCESEDPNRLVPIFMDPEALFFIVNGDEARNRVECFMSNGRIGPLTSMKVELPKNWEALYGDSQLRQDLVRLGRDFL